MQDRPYGLKRVGRALEPSGPPAPRAEVLLGHLDYFRAPVVNKAQGCSATGWTEHWLRDGDQVRSRHEL